MIDGAHPEHPVRDRDRWDGSGEPRDHDEVVARLRRAGAEVASGAPGAVDDLVAAAVDRAAVEGLVDVAWVVHDTPIGPLTLAATERGVVRIGFGAEHEVLDELAGAVSPRVLHVPARLDPLRAELDEYFEGRRQRFSVSLDRRLSQGYRRRVLEALSEVPYGRTVSYKELAERTGNPRASRAVGSAMATNPIPIVVPCHRVLRTGGALGGYGGGLDVKVWLLHLEGARLVRS